MNEQYLKFKQFKNEDKQKKIKDRSVLTLEYYELVGQLLDGDEYEYCRDFLLSVSEFIETKEYISDGQIEAIKNILDNHRTFHYQSYERDDLPF